MMGIRLVALIVLLFTLSGAGKGQEVFWNPNAYAIVGQAGEWDKQHFATIQSAVDSGATHIRVMAGEYAESVSINHALTLECDEGATLVNDGAQVSIHANADNIMIHDCTIQGNHDGVTSGDFFNGVGVTVRGSGVRLDGVKTVNLRSFSILNAEPTANRTTIENFNLQNVGTVRSEHKCASYAILFIAANEGHIVRNGYITGHSQAVGLWYGVNNTLVQGNTLINNYGWIGANCDGSRSAFETFGLGRGNANNRYFDNYIDGTNGAGFELADVLYETVVRGNTTRNTYGGAFGAMGSADNKGQHITIEGNTFYGLGNNQDAPNWFSGSGVIRGNYFIDWQQENNGTILIPNNAIPNGLDVVGNYFIRNSRVMRVSADGGSFTGNTIEDSIYGNYLYFDSGVSGFLIADNDMRGAIDPAATNRAINTNSNVAGLVVRNNYIEGEVWAGVQAVVEGNTIIGGSWTALVASTGSVYRDNRLQADQAPIVMGAGSTGTLVERNYGTKRDGSAVQVLDNTNCLAGNTCTRNWTVGQVPPP